MKSKQDGCLVVLLLKADLGRDTDLFNKMDPYVIFRLNDQTARSQIKDEAGKLPQWNEAFSFRCKEGEILFFTVMDKDPGRDDEVGSGSVNVHKDFIDNRCAYLYPIAFKGKSVGTVTLQLTFMPDDEEVVGLVRGLQRELDEKRKIASEIMQEIEENLRSPPRPKPESLLLKNLLDCLETKKELDKKFIEESLAKAEAPYLEKLKELNGILDERQNENEEIQIKNAESLDLVNQASYQLSLYKSLSEKGSLKIKVLELDFVKDKKYDPYVVFLVERQSYKTHVAKGMKKSISFNHQIEAKRFGDDLITVSVFDQTAVGSDDLLGTGAVDLISVVIGKTWISYDVELTLKQKKVGHLKIEIIFVRDN